MTVIITAQIHLGPDTAPKTGPDFWGRPIMFRGRCDQLRVYLNVYKLAEAIKKSANPRANQIATDRIIRYAKIVLTIYQPKVVA